jgi:pimeloyl-ACP methyl ester carboxylesterase
MPRVTANGLGIEYVESGPKDGEPIVLINGLAGQLVDWPPALVASLADRGFRTIVFDNRDAGLSSALDELGVPDLPGIGAGTVAPPYSVMDMASDVVGLLDALGIDSAHLLGASMGGVVAEAVAFDHPARVRSLNLAMTAGMHPVLEEPFRSSAMQAKPDVLDRETVIGRDTAGFMWCGGPNEVIVDETQARERAVRRYERSYRPISGMRHVAANIGLPDRRSELADLRMPTLVLHGEDDPVVPVKYGEELAAAIPGARLIIALRRGHQEEWLAEPRYVEAIVENTQRTTIDN